MYYCLKLRGSWPAALKNDEPQQMEVFNDLDWLYQNDEPFSCKGL